ncbi:MAG: hypothetical protein HZT40_04250 [Candidatus Thiothrix singaporensis]|uniref:Uncharacterized protein n=1 Tax=Candidatus Thiothrix singaporensis TaxID=2799669 RepID=A0A7L6APD6_9GAMM|nr:MAG: hypothetical protein HZT40_04250 [Candidatus Thiothrix singaporensis]
MLNLFGALRVYMNKPSVRFNNRVIYLALITPFFMSKVNGAYKFYQHPLRGLVSAFLLNVGSAYLLAVGSVIGTVVLSVLFYLGTYFLLRIEFMDMLNAKGLTHCLG